MIHSLTIDEGVPYCRLFAKYAAAFFSISFSSLSRAISLSRLISSSTSELLSSFFLEPATQLRSFQAGICSSSATDAMLRPFSFVRLTAFSWNSSVYSIDIFLFVMMRSFAFLHLERLPPSYTCLLFGGTLILLLLRFLL